MTRPLNKIEKIQFELEFIYIIQKIYRKNVCLKSNYRTY